MGADVAVFASCGKEVTGWVNLEAGKENQYSDRGSE